MVYTIIFMNFENGLVFELNQNIIAKIGKTKQNKERERILPGSPLAGPAQQAQMPVVPNLLPVGRRARAIAR